MVYIRERERETERERERERKRERENSDRKEVSLKATYGVLKSIITHLHTHTHIFFTHDFLCISDTHNFT